MIAVFQRAGATSDDAHRIPALDGMRGIAIMLVLFVHFTDYETSAGLANRIYTEIASVGWVGVDLFFVLSGFLITGLLLESKDRPHYFRNFYARRTLRIFPLYYACLFVWFVVVPWLHPLSSHDSQVALAYLSGEQAWYWSYLSNWRMGLDGQWAPLGLSVYWSLAIEEQFYLIWPGVVSVCSARVLRRVVLGLIGAAFAIRVALIVAGANTILVYVSTLTRMDTLAIGALVAIAVRDPAAWVLARRLARWTWPLSVLSLLAIWLALGEFSEYHPLMQIVGFPMLGLMFASLMVFAIAARTGSWMSGLFGLGVLRFFGRYSYAMYLFHLTIRGELLPVQRAHAIVQWGGVVGQLAMLASLTAVTALAAWLSWHLFEQHFLALKRHFTHDLSSPAGSAL